MLGFQIFWRRTENGIVRTLIFQDTCIWEVEDVEGLFWKLQPLVVKRGVKDKFSLKFPYKKKDSLSLKETKNGIFLPLDPFTISPQGPLMILFLGI